MGSLSDCTLGWIECHPGIAAWAQAVGALLAIFAVLLVSRIQITQAKRQEDGLIGLFKPFQVFAVRARSARRLI